MADKWELFWMMVIGSIVFGIMVCFWNARTDSLFTEAWVDGYITGYAEGKSGVPSRHPSPVPKNKPE
ncbi:MAG: hypothetical protein KGL39_55740 [Patescibacteria group bacterium]|nr:hypothetical protein [Patescibacteria group bacterium]